MLFVPGVLKAGMTVLPFVGLVGGTLLGAILVADWLAGRRHRRGRHNELVSRRAIPLEQWFCGHYQPLGYSRDAVMRLTAGLSIALGVPQTVLYPGDYPGDSFGRILSRAKPSLFGFDSDVELERFENEFLFRDVSIDEAKKAEIAQCETIGDLISWYELNILPLGSISSAAGF